MRWFGASLDQTSIVLRDHLMWIIAAAREILLEQLEREPVAEGQWPGNPSRLTAAFLHQGRYLPTEILEVMLPWSPPFALLFCGGVVTSLALVLVVAKARWGSSYTSIVCVREARGFAIVPDKPFPHPCTLVTLLFKECWNYNADVWGRCSLWCLFQSIK